MISDLAWSQAKGELPSDSPEAEVFQFTQAEHLYFLYSGNDCFALSAFSQAILGQTGSPREAGHRVPEYIHADHARSCKKLRLHLTSRQHQAAIRRDGQQAQARRRLVAGRVSTIPES